ncbi:hypothetical protein ACHAQJ_004757 [Trichoderma viride]
MQQWAENAKEYPAWWTQGQGDHLLFRRAKMRLRSDYKRSQSEKGNQQTTDVQQTFTTTNGHQYGTTASTLSTLAGATDLPQGPSLGAYTDDYLSTSNSTLYPALEGINGEIWNDGVRGNSLTAQSLTHLEMLMVPDFSSGAPNTALESSTSPYFDHPPNTLSHTVYEQSKSVSTFQEYWDEGEHAARLAQLQPEVLPQASNVSPAEFDFNDSFWKNMFAPSVDFALESDINTVQTSNKWEQSL